MGVKWKLVSVRVEIVLVLVQDRCTICSTQGSENHFDRTRWNSLVTRLKWNLVSICLEIVLVSVPDRYTVCALLYRRLRNHFGRSQWYS